MSFFMQVIQASKNSGGWTTKGKNPVVSVVLSGEWTGTWTFMHARNGIWLWRIDHGEKIPALAKWKEDKINSLKGDLSEESYVYSQLTGVIPPIERGEWVEKEVKSAILMANRIRTRKTRMKFLKIHSECWSVDKTMKLCWPKVNSFWRAIATTYDEFEKAMSCFSGLEIHGYDNEDFYLIRGAITRCMDVVSPPTVREMLRSRVLKTEKVYIGWDPSDDENDYVRPRNATRIARCTETLKDTLYFAKKIKVKLKQDAAPLPEIMIRLQNLVKERKWREIREMHDIISAYWSRIQYAVSARTIEMRENANFPVVDGVKQLHTREEFQQEGREMKHCVAGYWSQNCYILSFTLGEERATLELSPDKEVRQFRGVANETPSPEMQQKLSEFMALL